MNTQPTPPVDFAWTQNLLLRIMAGVDWLISQPAVMFLLVVGALVGLIQYAMRG